MNNLRKYEYNKYGFVFADCRENICRSTQVINSVFIAIKCNNDELMTMLTLLLMINVFCINTVMCVFAVNHLLV